MIRLKHARLWDQYHSCDIRITGDVVSSVTPVEEAAVTAVAGIEVQLNGALAIPGFINSHDHLDFNCFPALANGIYPDYMAWGADIHERYEHRIGVVKRIPQELRIRWGLYKNLLHGFTTVVNHGEELSIPVDLVEVIQEGYILHSPGFEKNWKWKLNHPFRSDKPFVIHAGEGTSDAAAKELDELARSNYLDHEIIVVHGVAMKATQAKHFRGLVWCPASNFFLLGQTAHVQAIREEIPVVFGTDSTLSASWDAWQHFRIAQLSGAADEDELMRMLTTIPAKLWGLKDRGELAPGKKADLLVLDPVPGIFSRDAGSIRMVIRDGKIRMIDDEMLKETEGFSTKGYSRIRLHDRIKWVEGDIASLIRDLRKHDPEMEVPFQYL